ERLRQIVAGGEFVLLELEAVAAAAHARVLELAERTQVAQHLVGAAGAAAAHVLARGAVAALAVDGGVGPRGLAAARAGSAVRAADVAGQASFPHLEARPPTARRRIETAALIQRRRDPLLFARAPDERQKAVAAAVGARDVELVLP